MRKIKLAVVLWAMAAMVAAAPVKYQLRGHLPDSLNGMKVYLYALDTDRRRIDSAVIRHGAFAMNGTYGSPSLARLLIVGNKRTWGDVEFGLEDAPTTFSYDGRRLQVTGGIRTEAQKEYERFEAERNDKLRYRVKMPRFTLDDLLKGKVVYTEEQQRERARIALIKDSVNNVFDQRLKVFVWKNKDNAIGAYYFNQFCESFGLAAQDSLLAVAGEEFLGSPVVKRIIASRKQNAGQMYSDFELPDKDGKLHKLSEYIGNGRYVLLDIWASWCVGCRIELPHIEKVYEKYKDKGFDVVLVSIDAERSAWLKAIEKDSTQALGHHLLDASSITRKIYGISSIPCNMLIGPDGVIVERNLRGKELGRKLAEVMGEPSQYVNPYIGTGGHGHVFMGANVPFGLVQVGPTDYYKYWDYCSGYVYKGGGLRGFAHTHLSGTGATDLGDILLLPVTDSLQYKEKFSHDDEDARAGYYAVTLQKSGVRAEMAATTHAAIHRYTYPDSAKARYIRLDLDFGIHDEMKHCDFKVENDRLVTGYRYSEGFADSQYVYFAARFSQPIKAKRMEKEDATWCLSLPEGKGSVLVKVGISPISVANALQNLDEEITDWNLDRVAEEAREAWNRQLGKMQIKTSNDSIRRIFYTALYHTMVAPSVFSDRNGDYWGADGKPHHAPGHTYYTTFSLWDTYRAAHPLMTLIHPELQKDIAETFMQIYREQKRLPVWHLMGNETNCMVGNPGIPVLADLLLKGFEVDREAAYEALKQTAMIDIRGMKELKKYGYIPCDLVKESVAKGLEYALADDAVARVAELLGKKKDATFFHRRSQSYRKYFDKKSLFMRGVTAKGAFREPFDSFKASRDNQEYTEGNAWQYTWLVPHDVHGLVSLFPNEQRFVEKLDSLFIVTGDLGVNAAPDVTGLIGQYAHGNEPGHHTAYLYNYVGMPWKGAERLREIMRTQYSNRPAGLCGNEDVGQMSAWYVLSAIGLYQVEPAGGKYIIGSPIVDEAMLHVGSDRTFRIIAHNNSPENIYVQSARLNGNPLTRSYLHFEEIAKGGTLELQMGGTPSATFGVKTEDRP